MKVYHECIDLQSQNLKPTYHDVTEAVKQVVARSEVKNGICVVYSQHTTCSVMIQECSHDKNLWGTEYLQQDLNNIMEKLIPSCRTEGQYMHPGPEHLDFAENVAKEDPVFSLNTDAHLRSVIFGRSESIVIKDSQLQMGEFGYVYLVDWDQLRNRKRVCQVQIIGE